MAPAEEEEEGPPPGVNHLDDTIQFPKPIRRHFYNRYKLFSKYDDGVWLTDDAWFGVTPEPLAHKIAQHISTSCPNNKTQIIDAFCGVGGNVIAFALSGRWNQIFAIEKDPATLKCAKHNAKIYGVDKRIHWIEGDCFEILKKRFSGGYGRDARVVFGSPPWGGPEYKSDEIFDLDQMQPYGLEQLHTAFSKITSDFVLYLPRTSDLNQLAKLVPEDQKMQVTHYCMEGFSKAVCAYFGNFKFESQGV
ncbi:MAG: hypothetical protein M1820_001485 [Bogoriella megaspora]|nr:MAG: hypothetical protein M1820_001485 [Bogoriella megaspora]